jgi:hypothetical protein
MHSLINLDKIHKSSYDHFKDMVALIWRMYDKSSYQLSLKHFHEKIFYLYVSFLSPSIEIVFPENINPSWLIPKTGQLGFSQQLVF